VVSLIATAMVNLKQRLSEGDISLFLRRSRTSHRPLTQSKSCPVKTDPVTKVVKDTIGMIAESEKEVEYAAREMEHLIRREKRAIEEFEKRTSARGGVGTIRGWLNLKRETNKNHQAAIEDMKRATDAMKAAEDKVAAIGDRMDEEERRLQERATELRRKSCDLFKLVADKTEKVEIVDEPEKMVENVVEPEKMVEKVEKAEKARMTEEGEIRICAVTSL